MQPCPEASGLHPRGESEHGGGGIADQWGEQDQGDDHVREIVMLFDLRCFVCAIG
jgi:hypothetical protein